MPSRSDRIITLPVMRIERERDGEGWFVITPRGHAWLHGDRAWALADKDWLDSQWRPSSTL